MQNREIKNRLIESFSSPVRDPLWKHIYLSKELFKICDTKDFQLLHQIKQLGPTYLVYPGALHSRASHSFGVFEIAKRILFKLTTVNTCPQLSYEGATSFLIASFLHDIGHFPYTHSLKELSLEEHEAISANIVSDGEIGKIIRELFKVDPNNVACIIDENRKNDNTELDFYRQLLSGVLDPDKLDYLNRDAFFCGVNYGKQDVDYVIDRMTCYDDKIAIYDDGSLAVENILFSKYSMYKSVYWHKAVRAATAMIKKSVITSINENLIKPNDLYRISDYQFFEKFSSINFKLGSTFDAVNNRNFYKTVYESTDEQLFSSLKDLNTRNKVENNIVKDFLKSDSIEDRMKIIIDIPEPIKFESDLTFVNNKNEKCNTEIIFNKDVSSNFSRVLRKIRVLAAKDIADKIVIEDLNKWKN